MPPSFCFVFLSGYYILVQFSVTIVFFMVTSLIWTVCFTWILILMFTEFFVFPMCVTIYMPSSKICYFCILFDLPGGWWCSLIFFSFLLYEASWPEYGSKEYVYVVLNHSFFLFFQRIPLDFLKAEKFREAADNYIRPLLAKVLYFLIHLVDILFSAPDLCVSLIFHLGSSITILRSFSAIWSPWKGLYKLLLRSYVMLVTVLPLSASPD